MAYETMILEKQDGVGVVTLNRPERLHALSRALTRELLRAFDEFEQDAEVKAIIVTGSGEKAFCAGGDIHEMSQLSEEQTKERGAHQVDWNRRIFECKKPTIAAMNGLAYGGGALLSTLFDIRLGCERTSFRFLGVRYQRVNSTWTLPMIVGWPIAKEILFTGRDVGAEEALRIGLLNRLVPASELIPVALEMGRTIAANDATTVQVIKEILDRDIGMSWQEMQQNEGRTAARWITTPPARESFKGFLEQKRG